MAQIQPLPISYEQLRSLALRELGRMKGPTQFLPFYGDLAAAAVKEGIVPNPYAGRPGSWGTPSLSPRDAARAQDVLWDLIIEGVIRPGLGQNDMNADLPFFHLTEMGKAAVAGTAASPYDPDGYLSRLRASIPNVDDVILMFLGESLKTFRIGCLLSSAVALGCASEKALLVLVESYASALPAAKADSFRKDTAGRMIKRQFEELNKKLQGPVKQMLPGDVREGLDVMLLGVFEMIRNQRNDAGHPTGRSPAREVVYASLTVFPDYLQKVYSLVDWLVSKAAAGGLP
jgi:hypothetical protein